MTEQRCAEPLRPNAPRVFAAFLALVFCLWPSTAADGERVDPAGGTGPGRLTGTVEVGPQLDSRRMRFNLYPDLVNTSDTDGGETPHAEVQNVVVYFERVDNPGGLAPVRSTSPMMRQEGMDFVPHVLAVEKGTEVSFPNGDPIFHNVFSLSRKKTFDLGRFPEGESKSVVFDKPGVVKVFCHIHSDMTGLVVVLDNPFFTMPDASGSYEIEGLPPGAYRVIAWHERAKPLKATVRIEPGQTTTLDFKIPLQEVSGG